MSSRPVDALSPEAFPSVLADARAGQGRAWEALYHSLAPAGAGYFRGQDAREPDDLTSEVFLALVKSIERFAGDAEQFRSFVFVIAHNRLQDERRKTMRRNGFIHQQSVDDMGDTRAIAADGDAVDGALERLSREHVHALCQGSFPTSATWCCCGSSPTWASSRLPTWWAGAPERSKRSNGAPSNNSAES